LTRKTLRHPKALMSRPPMAGPRAGAANSTIPALAGMLRAPRLGSRMRLIASGTIGAPASPWPIRAAISRPTPGTRAHAADARVKAAMAAVYAGSVPNRRASHGAAASPQASPSR
jgi:hypothetical protein